MFVGPWRLMNETSRGAGPQHAPEPLDRVRDVDLGLVLLDSLITASATSSGLLGLTPGGRSRPAIGPHAGVGDRAGEDRGRADARSAQVLVHREREAAEAELRGVVERRVRGRDLARYRRDVDEVAAPAIEHARHQRVSHVDRRAEVDVDHAVDLLTRCTRSSLPGARQPGVRHEHVDLARLPRRSGAPGRRRRGRARVRFDPVTQLRDEPVQHLGPAPGQDQVRAARVQRAGDRVTQSPGGARQEDARTRSARRA